MTTDNDYRTDEISLYICEDCHSFMTQSVLYSDNSWASYQCETEEEADTLLKNLETCYIMLLDDYPNTYGTIYPTGETISETQETCECCGSMQFGTRYAMILS